MSSPPHLGSATDPTDRPGPALGLVLATSIAVPTMAIAAALGLVSPLVIALGLAAAWSCTRGIPAGAAPGLDVAASVLLRAGIVLLGTQVAVDEVIEIGVPGLVSLAAAVTTTFLGTILLARVLGVRRDLALLVACGFSICGASAIGAVKPMTTATEDEVAAAIGLVTLFGIVAVVVLPVLDGPLGLGAAQFGSWVGISTPDVGQVVATASAEGPGALSAAVITKLSRVALLAPVAVGVGISRRRHDRGENPASPRPPLVPPFLVGFALALALRSAGVLPPGAIDLLALLATLSLTAAMVGIGAKVQPSAVRGTGMRPLALGGIAWSVACVAGLAATKAAAW